MDNPRIQQFQERAGRFQQIASTYQKKHQTLSVVRTMLFIMAAIALVYYANDRNTQAVLITAILFMFLFGWIVRRHNKVRFNRSQADFFVSVNREEIQRLEGSLQGLDEGNRFNDRHHAYTGDLDVFGNTSLFQLVNRCSTESGKATLARWMKSAANHEEIALRQAAVKELAPAVDWRQDLQVGGRHYEETPEKKADNINILLEWIATPNTILGKPWYTFAGYFLPLLTLTLIFLYFFYQISYLVPLAGLLLNGAAMRRASPAASNTYEKTYKSIRLLKAYLAMIEKIEARDFTSRKLLELKKNFQHDSFSASKEIRKLKAILGRLETRNNAFYVIFNLLFLLDIHFLRQAEKWKRETHSDLTRWFGALDEFEALASMGALLYANPEYHLPKITEEDHQYIAKGLGHPLLKKEKRVCNDFSLQGRGKIIVLTGSNMSGKSTFLRTLGTNAVLALMGGAVCAESMSLSVMQVFTSMRTEDSLEESVSSFYAELKRLRQLLEVVGKGKPVFFMLDEILKGTNSHDRHNGAAALIRQLSRLNASGLISTHDLELGSLAGSENTIENFNFTSRIIDDEIIFDYKLHEGICESFNASKLMEKMGIDMAGVNRDSKKV